MICIKKLFREFPYIITSCAHDTTDMICARGHIYADRGKLVASLDNGTRAECRQLRLLGDAIMDGDDGELSVAFTYTPATWQAVRRIMRPKQTACIKLAA
jgi:hypothetical protein